MAPVGVIGANGYTGQELLRILGRHDGVEVVFATSESASGEETVSAGLRLVAPADARIEEAQLVFLCVPHGQAVAWAERLENTRVRVVDVSADHRPGSGREAGWVYGLPELSREAVRGARRVSNPGCYPTGVILALRPLLDAGVIASAGVVIVDAASGVTGAGRSAKRELLFAEVANDYRAYALGNVHRHLPEMRASLCGLSLVFTPHLLPVPRGILETIYVPLAPGVDAATVQRVWHERYGDEALVSVLEDRVPGLADVVGTDRVAMGVVANSAVAEPLATLVVALDNLGKGAAGQAVQNMNLMLGFAEHRGLRC
ncbi:MAG: N-acetyl-gamma-glutamyl-phosphate reductase [Gemmatimonadetes bacterium]|nr:N-acetyl-gamma-glutamyl-phosphate reductase [Gemmatimonadota bacterium]